MWLAINPGMAVLLCAFAVEVCQACPSDAMADARNPAPAQCTDTKAKAMDKFESVFQLLQVTTRATAFDALLRTHRALLDASRDALQVRTTSGDWRTAATAAIILGELRYGPDYERFLEKLNTEDIQRAGRSAGGLFSVFRKYQGMALAEFQERILPLCWKALLLENEGLADWQRTVFIRILWDIRDARSLEPLLRFLKTTDSHSLAHDAAIALAWLGPDLVSPRLRAETATDERTRGRLQEVQEQLLDLAQ